MLRSRRVASLSAAVLTADWTTRQHRPVFAQADTGQSVPVVQRLPESLSRVTIYQYESCPFCRKVRSVLDYARLPYRIVEVHPLTKRETKEFAADYGKVPILRVDDVQLRDSAKIVEAVLLYLGRDGGVGQERAGGSFPLATRPLEPTTASWTRAEEDGAGAAAAWVRWTDEFLVQLVVMNIYRNLREARQTFDYLLTHQDFSWASRWTIYWSGVFVMMVVAGKRRSKFGVAEGDERNCLYAAVQMMADVGLQDRLFLGGHQPDKADFNVYGVLRSMEGLDTQQDLFQHVPKIKDWYLRMQTACGTSMAVQHDNAGTRGHVSLQRE